MHTGTEYADEAKRASAGMAPVVWPKSWTDFIIKKDGGYTNEPYYYNETQNTVYKIPLRTIIGRYMPRTELLMAWSLLKQNVAKKISEDPDSAETIKSVADYAIEAIKGIYNENALNGETTEKVSGERVLYSGDKEKERRETVYYSKETTHKSSFITFDKAGIESTKYGINAWGSKANDLSKPTGLEEKEFSVITDFKDAVVAMFTGEEEFTIAYTATGTSTQPVTTEDETSNEEEIKVDYTESEGQIEGSFTIKFSDIAAKLENLSFNNETKR